MSRLDDLIDLMQSACETYLVNPARNVRSAYIQVDNLCELAMKTWLQCDCQRRQQNCLADLQAAGLVTSAKHRGAMLRYYRREQDAAQTLQTLGYTTGSTQDTTFQATLTAHNTPIAEDPLCDWQAEHSPTSFKSFHEVSDEVRARHPLGSVNGSDLDSVIERIKDRRDKRNAFFHHHNLTGLAVPDKDCLYAFLDLHSLAVCLFTSDYTDRLEANHVVQAHITLLKLKFRASETGLVTEYYRDVLRRYGNIIVRTDREVFEFHALYEDARTFLERIRSKFETSIAESENEIAKINSLRRPTTQHNDRRRRNEEHISLLKDILQTCLD